MRVHGSGQGNFTLPDFSRFSVYYPFIDRLSDGYSSFSYQAGAVIEASATLAIEGFNAYGPPNATSGSFSPPCDPYASSADGTLSRTVYDSSGAQVAKLALQPQTTLEKFTLDVARNVTNQPVFGGNATVCDNFITLFNSTVSQGVFSPVPLKGTLQIGGALYPKNATCNDVEGWKIDLAFVERGLKACRSLKGYAGSGPGD